VRLSANANMPSGNGASRMLARKTGSAWEAFAPAKLNLYLDILGRRDDGFHELETLMAPIRLYDRLVWEGATRAGSTFELQYHPSTADNLRRTAPADERNLVYRAVHLIANVAGIAPTGRLTLLKRIPTEAGLGGGSSDAAAALVLANSAWELGYGRERLAEIGSQLGSDVPFFLAGQSAVCRGRGERVTPIAGLQRLHVVVVKPPQGVSTAAAFRLIDAGAHGNWRQDSPRIAELLERLQRGALAAAGRLMTNALERAAASLCPWIKRLRAAFDRLACRAHLMTGSGSAYFGVMRSARQARRAAGILSASNLGAVFTSATCR
jgi:4-diphosphocytidyl-2-C-methyl-D-erythritol kinase